MGDITKKKGGRPPKNRENVKQVVSKEVPEELNLQFDDGNSEVQKPLETMPKDMEYKPIEEIPELTPKQEKDNFYQGARQAERREVEKPEEKVSCLKNKTIKVRFINRNSGFITDPKHVLFGGMSQTAKRRYTVHLQRNGQMVNPLTDAEKDFLEEVLMMEKNALSIYKKDDNFWKNRMVELVKGDNYLDLSVPMDYISYKILLTNKDYICPSEEALKKYPKHTYQFVITSDEAELENSIDDLTGKSRAYKLFSYIEKDFEKLSYLCEKVAGKTIHVKNKELILDAVNKMIMTTTSKFIEEAENKYLDTEIMLKKAVDKGIVRKHKTEYVLVSHNLTLCPMGLNPSLRTACEFLNRPANQESLFEIQAQLE